MARKAAAQTKDTPELVGKDPVLTEDIEIDLSEPAPSPQRKEEAGNGIASPEPVTVETAPEPAPPAPPEEDQKARADSLQKRLEEMETAQRLALEQQTTRERQFQQAQVAQWQAQKQAWDAQYDTLVNTLGAVQSQIEAATQEYEVVDKAASEGDATAAKRKAELTVQLGRLGAKLDGLEARKEVADNQIEQWRQQRQQQPRQQQPQQQQRPQPQNVEQAIADSGLPERAKTWLRAHPEYLQDPSKNQKLQSAHGLAYDGDFSDRYFNKMEELLDIKSAGNGSAPSVEQPKSRQSAAPVSAPPTREAPSMSTGRTPHPTKVTLSADEREVASTIAQSRNITQAEAEREFAKQKLRMMEEKKQGQR